MIPAAAVKARIAARAEEFIHELVGEAARREGVSKWRVGKHGSLVIQLKDGELVFYSHEDGSGGDAIKLWQQQRGGSAGDALKECAAWAGISGNVASRPLPSSKAPPPATDAIPYALSDHEIGEAMEMVRRLLYDPTLCERVAKARDWQPETIRALAQEASLGWHKEKLAFLYDSGVKLRWRAENGERVIRWHFGKPWIWRGAFLRIPDFRRVIVTEGETDAISLIDAGEETHGETLVVALPSASTFKPEWAARFAGKDVTLALDNDHAGQKATARVGTILRRVAKSVSEVDWGAALNAC